MNSFRLAARAYLLYGVIYWLGGVYLATQGVGVRGERMMQAGVAWVVLGLVFVVAIPYLLAGRRAWFLKTPALMGLLSGAPLVPCFIERIGPERFNAYPGEPIFVATDLPREQAIQRAAQQFADQLSERLHAHPEYWYHFYRYWDSQQDEGA